MPLPHRGGKRLRQQSSISFRSSQKLGINTPEATFTTLMSAVECGSNDTDVYLLLCQALWDRRQYAEALAVCERGLKICGAHPALLCNHGVTLRILGRYEEALQSMQQMAAILPAVQQPWINLGNIYCDLGDLKESIRCYRRALHIDSQDPNAHYNLSHALLVSGDYRNGFREHEWRPTLQKDPSYSQVRWDGSPLKGKRILLHQEQGIGDTIQFLRYVPIVGSKGGSVLVSVPAPLKRLLSWMRGSFEIAPNQTVASDVLCSFPSLPFLCATGDEPIPPPATFDVPREFAAKWAQILGNSPLPKIGLVWAGNPDHQNDFNRSMSLGTLLPLVQREDVQFFSLQVGSACSAIAKEGLTERITDLSPHLTDYAETAAALSQLDLVITVDTSVAHLAGTLNVPTWMMIPFAPDWRWLLGRSNSPWYSSLRIFRQQKPGDWPAVVNEVIAALSEFLRQERSISAIHSKRAAEDYWSNPVHLLPRWNVRARMAADFIPSGAAVLDIGCGAMTLEQFLPPGCSYLPCDVIKRDERTIVCDLNAGQFPAPQNATHVSMLGLLEHIHDWQNLLRRLGTLRLPLIMSYCPTDYTGHLRRSELGWVNHLSLEQLCAGLSESGFRIQTSLRTDTNQVLIRAVPEVFRAQPRCRVLVMSSYAHESLSGRIGLQTINALLPAEAEVHYANCRAWNVPDGNYDLLILGTGDSLSQPDLTEQLLSLVRSIPRTVGIFGTQYREGIDRNLLSQVLAELTVWFARHEEDLLLYGKGRQNALHLGDWLLSACPMTRWTKDDTLQIHKKTGGGQSPDRTIQEIQQYRRVISDHLQPFLCALTSAEQVTYNEQRECGSAISSGKFRSMLVDIFGRTWPESTAFEFDRAAVAGYRSRTMKIMAGMPQLFTTLLGLDANA